jgi:xanthine dehydrogenase accessory factor
VINVEKICKEIINRKNEELLLLTVTDDEGSAPRARGARALVGKKGLIAGTVGGGNLEYNALKLAESILAEKKSCVKKFDLKKDFGMICGGGVSITFQYITDFEFFKNCLEALARDKNVWLLIKDDFSMELLEEKPQAIEGIPKGGIYSEQINRSGKTYIFGAGHVAQALCPVLSKVGFRCVVFDDRPEFARKDLFPDAFDVMLGDFKNIKIDFTPNDFIIVVTRGHAHDYTVLKTVLSSAPSAASRSSGTPEFTPNKKRAYIGAMGSKTKILETKRRLKEEGVSQEQLDSLYAPIGLPINSDTPEEIAISIAAQLIMVRNQSL